MNSPLRLAVVRDFPEELWPSMDLAAEQLLVNLSDAAHAVRGIDVCPPYRKAATQLPLAGRTRLAQNMDRLWNRFRTLPRHLRQVRNGFDGFHIVDHSYAHVVHDLPATRTGVYCHDLDTFRCLLNPTAEPRPWWFRQMMRRIFTGLQQASLVFHSTHSMGRAIVASGLATSDRLRYAPCGVAPEYLAVDLHAKKSNNFLGIPADAPYLLHVGSCIPRKRIDVLLNIMANLRKSGTNLRLVKVGDDWTEEQRRQIAQLQLESSITHLGKLPRTQLAEVYRYAAAVLIPSEAEGFGIPVIEALACGAAVVAGDLDTLREAGGSAATYAPVADVEAWTKTVLDVLAQCPTPDDRERRRRWAAQFTWSNQARTIAQAYCELLQDAPSQAARTGKL